MTHSPNNLARHENSFLTLEQTVRDQRQNMVFRKTYPFDGSYIDQKHQAIVANLFETGMINVGIEGWLLEADALKLYELSYFCGGDILELGTYRGLSTSIEAAASFNSASEGVIVSIDLDPIAEEQARINLHDSPGANRVHLFTQEGGQAVRDLASAKRQFKFCFIDHSHRYEHVFNVCQSLHRVLELGAFALFHDFNDPRNADAANAEYGVYQGVMDGLNPQRFEFWGIYGCCGLFRRIGPC